MGPSGNQEKGVVAVLVGLGSETAGVMPTPSVITPGLKASRLAKHEISPIEPIGISPMLLIS